jgi:hypothetical protein
MRAARYRLKFFTGATLTASTYGGGKYGDTTYGMQASDSLTTAHHRLVPWPGGALTIPSWIYRRGDTEPDWEAMIVADDGAVSYNGLYYAWLVLTNQDDPSIYTTFSVWVVTESNGDQHLHRTWNPGDLDFAGNFRAAVVLLYQTGRRLTVPADDRHQFILTPGGNN